MSFRSCTACVRTAGRYSAPRVNAGIRSLSAFVASRPALKKHQAKETDFEDEFEEDLIDDVDAELQQEQLYSSSTTSGGQSSRGEVYNSAVQQLTSAIEQDPYHLKSNLPSNRLLTSLVSASSPETLSKTLDLVRRWRLTQLSIPNDRAVEVLIKRMRHLQGGAAQEAVRTLANRTKYGIEINDIKTLYPLFIEWSKPFPESTNFSLSQQSELLFDLLTLAEQHSPSSTSQDFLAHLSTLAIALQSPSPSSRISSLISHLESLGEDYIVQEVSQTRFSESKRLRFVTRYRTMRIVEEMRKSSGQYKKEVEWFAHLAEKLLVVVPSSK